MSIDHKQTLETLRTLVRFNTVEGTPSPSAPFGQGVRDCLDYVLALTASWGWRTADLDGYCGWAEVGEGPLFGILGHLDTVPFGEGWTHDPLGAEIEDGKLYGRGTQDDKGPMVAALYAVRALEEEGKLPPYRLRFIFGCNEETGWACIERYLATEEHPLYSISPDGDFPVINCEKGLAHVELSFPCPEWLLELSAGERVNMVPNKASALVSRMSDVAFTYALHYGVRVIKEGALYRLSATGKSAHGSTPFLGENALTKLLTALTSLDEVMNVVGRALADHTGTAAGIGFSDEPSGGLTMNAGTAHIVDGNLVFGLDIRFPISYTQQDVLQGLSHTFPFATVRVLHDHPSLYLSADHPLVVGALDAYEAVMGTRPAPLTIGGATYARALPNAVAFGPVFPGDEEMCHQADEYVRLDRLEQMTNIYHRFFHDLHL